MCAQVWSGGRLICMGVLGSAVNSPHTRLMPIPSSKTLPKTTPGGATTSRGAAMSAGASARIHLRPTSSERERGSSPLSTCCWNNSTVRKNTRLPFWQWMIQPRVESPSNLLGPHENNNLFTETRIIPKNKALNQPQFGHTVTVWPSEKVLRKSCLLREDNKNKPTVDSAASRWSKQSGKHRSSRWIPVVGKASSPPLSKF